MHRRQLSLFSLDGRRRERSDSDGHDAGEEEEERERKDDRTENMSCEMIALHVLDGRLESMTAYNRKRM